MKQSTKIILTITHIVIPFFTIFKVSLERSMRCRPDLPESAFLPYKHS